MPQLDFNLFFSNFIWLIFSLIFFYIFILMYILPKLLKVLTLRRLLLNYYTILDLETSIKLRNLVKENFNKINILIKGFNVK